MHEMPMCRAVLEAVEDRAGDRPVEQVGVRVGEDLGVLPDVFEQGFQVLAQGGVADGATTEVEAVDGDELVLTWIRYREVATTEPATTEPATTTEGT